LQAELVAHSKPDLPRLKQADENPDHEVKVLRGCVAGRGWEAETSLAEKHIKGAFVVHDCVGQGAVKHRDQHAQQQSRDFHNHPASTLSRASRGRNQWKNLIIGLNGSLLWPSQGRNMPAGALFVRARIKAVTYDES